MPPAVTSVLNTPPKTLGGLTACSLSFRGPPTASRSSLERKAPESRLEELCPSARGHVPPPPARCRITDKITVQRSGEPATIFHHLETTLTSREYPPYAQSAPACLTCATQRRFNSSLYARRESLGARFVTDNSRLGVGSQTSKDLEQFPAVRYAANPRWCR